MKPALKAIAGLLLLFAAIALCGALLRDRIAALGDWFMATLGVPGMALGCLLADGFHFPIPPQFYMIAAIASGERQLPALAAICSGTLVGDGLAVLLGRALSRARRVQRWLEPSRPAVERIVDRHGVLAALIAGISPLPASTQCNIVGLYRMPHRMVWITLALRVPRLLVFYLVLKAGWLASA